MSRNKTSSRSPKRPQGTQAAPGFVRIIGGQWRGRKLPVHDVTGLRPTTDRVKETLFNWLMADIYQAKCLDLFAGSGGLGFEALSRQAEKVTLLEFDSKAAGQLKQNLAALNTTSGKVVQTDTLAYLTKPGQPYDIVFIDPPFRRDMLATVFDLLEQNGWLADNAMIYVEAESELGQLQVPVSWSLHREKTAGQISYRLYQREGQ
ncbi:16S rRNA (guanine(966)-N(2))-methyltransferase RsmD [Parasalinivibrio latis]|uniref:16S rRNA (guanine(966)-N(2))-methyltransferase RsmD n=1 Tax=Parasalinivibrio latis TaxID=2952610 RepID=UPI0030E28380